MTSTFRWIFAVPLFALGAAAAADWPQFRGPDRSGVSDETGLPTEWSAAKNIVWKTELPGAGASSPITYGDRIYVTCYSGYGQPSAKGKGDPGRMADLQRRLICLDRKDGTILWDTPEQSKTKEHPYGAFVNLHGYASSTPAADDLGIYTYYGAAGAFAYDHEGKLRWRQPCGKATDNFGSASSPVVFGDLVIINAEVEGSGLVALDRKTGKEVWRVATDAAARSTPLLVKVGDTHELVFHSKVDHKNGTGLGRIAAVDPRDGTKLWECQALDNYLHSSPIAHDGIVYAIASYPGWAVAIRAGGRGDVSATHKLWEIKRGSEMCTPVYFEGHLYWAKEDGACYCVDAKTGKVVYQERLPGAERIYASGVIADKKLYYVSRENGAFVLAASPKYQLLAHNVIETDKSVFNATPAIRGKHLLLRSDRYLYCVGTR